MSFRDRWNRRTFLGALAALSSAIVGKGSLLASSASAASTKDAKSSIKGFGSTGDIYKELGVTTVINGEGTMTVLGGSLMRPRSRSGDGPGEGLPLQSVFPTWRLLPENASPSLCSTSRRLRCDRHLRRGRSHAVGPRRHTNRQQSQIHRTITRPHWYEIGSPHPEIPPQPFRPPIAFHWSEVGRRGDPQRNDVKRAIDSQTTHHDALFEFCKR